MIGQNILTSVISIYLFFLGLGCMFVVSFLLVRVSLPAASIRTLLLPDTSLTK